MGTWGSGPFDSDAAEDFADGLERLSGQQRVDAIRLVLERVLDARDPENSAPDVVAVAAVVAANVPAGAELPWIDEDYPRMATWLEGVIDAELVALTIRSLAAAVPQAGWYWRSWVDNKQRAEAETMVASIRSVLAGCRTPCSSPGPTRRQRGLHGFL